MSQGLLLLGGALWPELAMACALGVSIGAATCGRRAGAALSRLSGILWCLAAAAGLLLSASGIVPGRYGLWAEMGSALLAAYAAGCGLGCSLRRFFRREPLPPNLPPAVPPVGG